MRMRIASLMAVVLVAACSPAPETDGAPTPGEAPAAKRMPLPDCAEVEAQDADADGWKHPDCRLMLADQSGLAIEARYAPAEDDSTEVKVQVVQPGDATIQEIVERMGNTFNGPNLEDFDKDGMTDILLPLETGNVNTTWAVWRQSEPGKFVRVGEPSGVSVVKTDSGFIAVQGRSSAAEYYVDFYKLEADSLKLVTTARVAAKLDDKGEKVVGSECVLEGADGVAAPDAAKAQFCAEPVVDGLVKDMTAEQ
jgi:hypothetical protein